ncbi:putative zinc-binding metallopeptidase [Candidatus Pelagibacter communis]|uniref:putative zinc-binding metallopeptidase n=1 Tax=Pelagibacter ubique TaxID=198252 RepID=UPI00065B43C1|nr:putative zinc-binding metallopeptidase [Candidatus Pelagibacter ubique]
MRVFVVLVLIIFFQNKVYAGNITAEVKKSYKERTEFVKKYISTIKENRKTNKKFKGSIVESVSGRLYTRWGSLSQYELDQKALKDCKNDGGVDCLVRFRTLKKNPKYNRLARYNNSKKSLKVLGKYIKSKKITSTKEISILVSEENYREDTFYCAKTKSNHKDETNFISKAIEIYPISFLRNSGLRYVMICEDVVEDSLGYALAGLAPGHVDKSPGVFYLNLSSFKKFKNPKTKKKWLQKTFHHEFYHIIDSSMSLNQLDQEWERINETDYTDEPLLDGSGIDTSVAGFISKYARYNSAEDKAELFTFMITQHKDFKKAIAKDKILAKKTKLMISRLKKVSPEINKNFWKNLN